MHGPSVAVHSSYDLNNLNNNTSLNLCSGISSNKLLVADDHRRAEGGDDSDKENRLEAVAGDRKLNGCSRKVAQWAGGSRDEIELEGCTKCQERFERVIRRVDPLLGFLEPKGSGCEKRSVSEQQIAQQLKKKQYQRELTPLQISISVVDPDNNNLNVCLCSSGPDTEGDCVDYDDEVDQAALGNRICTRCKNIINQQPLDHRKGLISQRLTLAHDIIVNRVDSQFLNTAVGGNRKINYEPYTPDSMESHSPMLLGLNSELQSSSSSSSFTTTTTDATTATKSSSVGSSRVGGQEPVQREGEVKSVQDDLDLIERDEKGEKNQNGRPELQTMCSVEMTGGGGGGAVETKNASNSGVNAKQLKFRLERLQILSRMPGHAKDQRKSDFSGRIEFENQMRKRELKEFKKAATAGGGGGRKKGKVLCCYQEKEGAFEREAKEGSKSQCSVM